MLGSSFQKLHVLHDRVTKRVTQKPTLWQFRKLFEILTAYFYMAAKCFGTSQSLQECRNWWLCTAWTLRPLNTNVLEDEDDKYDEDEKGRGEGVIRVRVMNDEGEAGLCIHSRNLWWSGDVEVIILTLKKEMTMTMTMKMTTMKTCMKVMGVMTDEGSGCWSVHPVRKTQVHQLQSTQ